MKKILLTAIGFGFALGTYAQEAADRKVQAGLIIGAGMNFQKMGTKNIATNGIGGDFTIGSNINFSFNNTIGLTTGVEFDFSSTNFKANTSAPIYYRYDDTKILRANESNSSNSLFKLTERKQKATYITIPTMVLFRTNYIGYFRYFGKFGLKHSFLVSSKSNDEGATLGSNSEVGPQTAATNKGMKMKSGNDLFFYKGSVGLAGGAEWNFSGSTCLLAEIGYYYGFTPLYYSSKEDKRSLYTSGLNNGTGSNNFFNNAATQSQLMLKISILF